MLLAFVAIVLGLALLVWSADKFIDGAAAVAINAGMSPLLVGLTIVSFGTSAPEVLVSLMAALSDSGSLAVGNALGSNIANIGLVLGITALIAPLPVTSSLLRQEFPLLIGITLLAGVLLADLQISLLDGLVLLTALVLSLYLFGRFQKNAVQQSDELVDETKEVIEENPHDLNSRQAWFWLIVGLLVLMASSRLLVWGAVEVATALGVSKLIIGLTIVAIGTSLPELAASISSALKGHHDIAVGNVVGSNIFNLAAVMAVPGFFSTISLDSEVLLRDYGVMLLLTLALFVLALLARNRIINRAKGGLLAAVYVSYLVALYLSTSA